MVSLNPPICNFGVKAPHFDLPGTDGRNWTLDQCMGEKGLVVMFICNHCPYVRAIHQNIIRDTEQLRALGVGSVAISSNDFIRYPEDNFENMQRLAQQLNFSFPYLLDESQQIARQYGAVCTPDFFGYNNHYELQYRGRLDASRKEIVTTEVKRDLFDAMTLIAETGQGPREQFVSIGCSIKWK